MNRIPNITKNLLIINVLAFLATAVLEMVTRGGGSPIDLNDILGLHFFMASDFHIYQLITYMFMHGNLQHIFFNMFALWMFGCVVENVWGPKKFLLYYLICGIGAGLFQEAAQFANYAFEGMAAYDYVNINGLRVPMEVYLNKLTTVGASGSIYGILLAFGMIFPEQRIFIFPLPVPIKAKWFVMIYAAIELFAVISTANDGVAHIAHLGGMVFGFFLIRYWRNHPTSGYGTMRGGQFFDNMRKGWEKRSGKSAEYQGSSYSKSYTTHSHDEQKTTQEEIDAMLDKIRKSGYDSLTKEEKQKLFDHSRKS